METLEWSQNRKNRNNRQIEPPNRVYVGKPRSGVIQPSGFQQVGRKVRHRRSAVQERSRWFTVRLLRDGGHY